MHKYPKINYIGNKDKISSWICEQIPKGVNSIFDAFSGGASVSYEAKNRGYKVISNDIMLVNYNISKALIENMSQTLDSKDVKLIFSGNPTKGFMYENYANKLYFPEECMELDLYTNNIKKLDSEYKRSLAYSILRRAMIRKMPYSRFTVPWDKIVQLRDEEYSYSKYKRKRAYHNQSFEYHFLHELNSYNSAVFDNNRECKAYNEDIFNLVEKVDADLIYLDPPYTGTMNNYFGFYGAIDEMLSGKKLQAYDNNFVDKKTAIDLFDKLFQKLKKYKYWMLSYNNSSYPTRDQLIKLLSKYSNNVKVLEHEHIYKITGKENKNKNIEYLFVVENKE